MWPWTNDEDKLSTIDPEKSERHNLPLTHSPGPPRVFLGGRAFAFRLTP